jgi:hypothetical protein
VTVALERVEENEMHSLEHSLFVLSIAVEKDEIGKAELARILGSLAGASHFSYQPTPGRPDEIEKISLMLGARFESLLYPGGIEEGEAK